MAVVQISRIQVRRGQKGSGSGVPQLASGEFGWAVDSQELYIGNGSVDEGAPAVGNTQVLTSQSDLFSVADTYTYKKDDSNIQTGSVVGSPVKRSLQSRLDDRVSGKAFGLTGVASQDATAKLQAAIDQLFINDATKGSVGSRVILYLEAGTYTIDETVYIPPYCSIVGEGSDRTVIKTSTSLANSMFKTVNETSTPGTYAAHSSTSTSNQPREIRIEGVSFETTVDNVCLDLDSTRDSKFVDIKFKGNYDGSTISDAVVGVRMNNLSTAVSSKNNLFERVRFEDLGYGVYSDWDANKNTFVYCEFENIGYGAAFGAGLGSLNSAVGSGIEFGASDNKIIDSKFNSIYKQAIWFKFGKNNLSQNNYFSLCGNDGGAEYQNTTSIIKYEQVGNTSVGDFFTRSSVLGYNITYMETYAYLPEIEGAVVATLGQTHQINTLSNTGTDSNGPIKVKKFRLPGEVDVANLQYEIDYIITSNNYTICRSGTLKITTDGYNKTATVSDEYDFTGTAAYEDSIGFGVRVTDVDADSTPETIDVLVSSSMPSDDVSVMQYKINLRKSTIDATGE